MPGHCTTSLSVKAWINWGQGMSDLPSSLMNIYGFMNWGLWQSDREALQILKYFYPVLPIEGSPVRLHNIQSSHLEGKWGFIKVTKNQAAPFIWRMVIVKSRERRGLAKVTQRVNGRAFPYFWSVKIKFLQFKSYFNYIRKVHWPGVGKSTTNCFLKNKDFFHDVVIQHAFLNNRD